MMVQGTRYTTGFKEAVIAKLLNRGINSIAEICMQEGIGKSSAYKWIQEYGSVAIMNKQKSTQQWTAEEKLAALVASNGLNEEAFGVFLRKEGLHSHQIQEWRAEVLEALGPQSRKPGLAKDDRNQRIKELERDLHRKDKALAEASALLILQKKVNLIWGNKSEDEK